MGGNAPKKKSNGYCCLQRSDSSHYLNFILYTSLNCAYLTCTYFQIVAHEKFVGNKANLILVAVKNRSLSSKKFWLKTSKLLRCRED